MRPFAHPSLPTRALLALVALGMLGWPAAAGAQEDPWPTLGGDAARTGTAPGPEPPYREAWSTELQDDRPLAGPILAGGAVVVVGGTSVAALDPSTGSPMWRADREEGPAGLPAAAAGVVVHAEGIGEEARLVGRALEDGEELWSVDVGAPVLGSLAVTGDGVVAAAADGRVLALSAEDGDLLWDADVEEAVGTAPAVGGGVVTVVAVEARAPELGPTTVVALDEDTGRERWRFSPETPSISEAAGAAVAEDAVFVGMSDGAVHALEIADGTERWIQGARAGFQPAQVPAATAGALVVADRALLFELDPATGDERWIFQVTGEEGGTLDHSAPVLVGDAVVVGDTAGRLSAVDSATALLVWQGEVGPGAVGPPAADGRRIYAATSGPEGRVVAFEHDPTGTLLAEPSLTVVFPLRAVANFAGAALIVGLGALVLFRWGPGARRAQEEG